MRHDGPAAPVALVKKEEFNRYQDGTPLKVLSQDPAARWAGIKVWFDQRSTPQAVESVRSETRYYLVIANAGPRKIRCGLDLVGAPKRD